MIWRGGEIEQFYRAGIPARRRLGPPSRRGPHAVLLEQDEPLIVDDARLHPAFQALSTGHPEIVRFAGIRLPNALGGRTGTLSVARGPGREPFDAQDVETLRELAVHATTALRNVESREALSRALRRTILRHNIVRLSLSGTPLAQAAGEALRMLVDASSARDAELWIIAEEGGHADLAIAAGRDTSALFERSRLERGEGIPGVAWEHGTPVIVPDIAADERFVRRQVIEAGLHGFTALPLKYAGEVVAVLCCAFEKAGTPPLPDMDLMEEAGSEIAQLIRTHRAERRLRESEERHRNLVEHLPLGVYVEEVGPDGSARIYTSPQYEHLLRIAPPRSKEDWLSRVHPDDLARNLEGWREERLGKGFWQADYRVRRVDGSYVWVRDRAVNLGEAPDGSRVYRGFLVDISEQKAAEEALRASEEKYRSLVEQVPLAIYTQAPDERGELVTVYTSPQMETLFDLRPAPETREQWAAEIHPDDRERVLAEDGRGGDQPWDAEYRAVNRSGRVLWIRDRAEPLFDAEGRLIAYQGFYLDITRQKEAERALYETTHRLQRIIGAAPVAIITLDPELRVTSWNPAAEAMFGWAAEEVVGGPYPLVPAGHEREVERMRRRTMSGRGEPGVETVRQRRDGSLVHVRLAESPLRDAEGNVTGAVVLLADISDRKRAEEVLTWQAYHDPLTGLSNRARFADVVQQRIADRHGGAGPFVLELNLDRFRVINNTLGQENGDLVLKEVAARLQRVVLDDGIVARVGGDTFVVGLFQPGAAVEEVAQTVLREVEAAVPVGELPVPIEATIGIAACPEHGESAEALLMHADVALQMARQRGRRYASYAPEEDPYQPVRLVLLDDFRRALEAGSLGLAFQPIRDLKSRRVAGAEALLRWEHPARGAVPPGELVPLVEETALIYPLTAHVIDAAVRQLAAWQEAGFKLAISVNVSARNLLDGDLPGVVTTALRSYSVAPGSLGIEITESALISDLQRTLETVERLKQIGVRIALDDFGAGYSSFSLLQQLPLDQVKIDRSFVVGITRTHNGAAMARSLIDLAHNLGLEVVAEGVEDRATYQILSALGCDYAQGYYISEPLPAEELAGMLR